MKTAGDLAGNIWELVADGALDDGDVVIDGGRVMYLNEFSAVAGFKPRFQKHDAASVDGVGRNPRKLLLLLLPRFDGCSLGNVFLAKISSVPKIVHARRPTA